MEFKSTLKDLQNKINQAIDQYLPSPNTRPARLHEAMIYSLKAGGKRLRPILLLTAHSLYKSDTDPLPAAVAIESLHTYSLIHDDLPCMDNSDLRRGLPTCHKKFDQTTALLAGDALLTYAFFLISNYYKDTPKIANELTRILSLAAGSTKLIGGQTEDFFASSGGDKEDLLNFIHQNKTAALIVTSLTMGLILNGAPKEKIDIAKKLGFHLGMAFQIIDDILDLTATEEDLGKTQALDIKNDTLTFPTVYGIETSTEKAHEHTQKAIDFCKQLGGTNDFLLELILQLEHRIA